MKKKFLLGSFLFLVLMACQPEKLEEEDNDENNQQASLSQTSDSNRFEVTDRIKIDNKKCQTIEQESYCDSVIIETDTFKDQNLNNYVYQTITGSEEKLTGNLKTALDNISKKQLEEFSKRYNEEDGEQYPYAQTSGDNFKLISSNPQLIFFKHVYTEYTGGAHSNTNVYNLVINSNTYQDIILDKILLPNTREKLLKLQKDALLKALIQTHDDVSEEDTKKMMNEWDIQLSTNWGFDKNNLLFTYSPYEAAPYSYGVIDIAIPKDQLNDIIKPKYFDLIFGKTE